MRSEHAIRDAVRTRDSWGKAFAPLPHRLSRTQVRECFAPAVGARLRKTLCANGGAELLARRHTYATVVAFADGHAKWANQYAEKKLRWQP